MILPHVLTKEGAAFLKETLSKKYAASSNDVFRQAVLVDFVSIAAEIEDFIETMKEKNEDLYQYNVLLDKYTVLKQLYNEHL